MTLRVFPRLCGGFVALTGLLVLLGWALGIGTFTSLLSGYPPAQPVTAAIMCATGCALLLQTARAANLRWAVCGLAGLAAILCLLTLLAHLGTGFEIDRWLFASRLAEQPGDQLRPGRMSEVAAAAFLLTAFAIVAKALLRRRFQRMAIAGATVALLLGAVTLLAFLFETAPLYEVVGFGTVSLPTAATLVALSAGALAAEPIVGWPRRLTLDTPGGQAVRALLPWAIGLPIAMSGLALVGSRAGLYSPDFQLAAVSALTTVLASAVVILAAGRIDATNAAREAEHTARALAEERLQQAQKMAALGQIASNVAHDFNNLLFILDGALKTLAAPSTEPGRRTRHLEAGEQALARAADLARSLLAFARKQPVQKQAFDAIARVRAMRHVLCGTLGSRLTFAVDLPDAEAWVEADPTQFDVAILNLVVNARDASAERGHEVSVSVETIEARPSPDAEPEPRVAVRVRDFGTGIPPDVLPRLFEPFYTTKEAGLGTGLGLSQAYAFARQSGGDLTVDSTFGVGSTFTILLPLMQRARAELANAPRTLVAAGQH